MPTNTVVDEHILHIIQNNEIFEQSVLQKILQERGYDMPQATLSRRLKKLKIAKIAGVYKIIDFNQPHIPLILNIHISDLGLIVLHTHPGQASSLAYFLDKKYVFAATAEFKDLGMIGTIAGDDTVLVIIKNIECLHKVLNSLYENFSYLKK